TGDSPWPRILPIDFVDPPCLPGDRGFGRRSWIRLRGCMPLPTCGACRITGKAPLSLLILQGACCPVMLHCLIAQGLPLSQGPWDMTRWAMQPYQGACGIVESCDDCHALAPPLPAGVNPRGLRALELWQTDVTQIAEFGRLKYVHVTVDTFSSAMWASAHTGEKARDVIAHWRQAFAVLGIPSAVKTDNGPAYASQQVRQFLQ
ncbi:hypothetical protein DV515_00019281, partial [Chloebia gouldiae]